MEIYVHVDDLDPPVGTVRLGCGSQRGGEPTAKEEGLRFNGWLGLLAALDGLIGADADPSAAHTGRRAGCSPP